MSKKEIVIIADYTTEQALTLEEVCASYGISLALIHELINQDVLHFQVHSPTQWQFDADALHRIQTAMRLQRDLELNVAGVAMVMELIEEMETLRSRVDLLERHLLK